MMEPRIVEVRENVLRKNDRLAHHLRDQFRSAGVFVINLVSSPGSGKTTLLRETLIRLRPDFNVAAVVGDLATENDAKRLAESGAPIRQITTGTTCHLDASMIERAIMGWDLKELDFLFIENVGNLVCPASYDLGEDYRVVLFSVTEGEDKPVKYPTLVSTSDLALVTKIDLADVVGFNREVFSQAIEEVRPEIPLIWVSARTSLGMDTWLTALVDARNARISSRTEPFYQ
ncbi:hydrogenase accessory protein HypB [Sulfobacillus acidophilus TPY]|uniref:Hydrogenase accessory protein HypB n=1 Tax=Sulfobacillus acidophilus (strain ATCC 700253 / DSM 10332 / NAL) TaxID=679936 RepID=G8U1S3_SULAD|nr:hydrogenase accessory protein HypB [Sulfobacillus acidophilus TPY]AEW07001.1 hydrogenase accessory protein HypB [Sulfobacillus acidophilus DSM 10332]